MGSAGLPALSGFIGEFLTIFGTFISGDTFPNGYSLPYPHILGALAATGVILGAIYLLYMFQKVFFGPLNKEKNGGLRDLSGREFAVFLPLILGIFALGLFPQRILTTIEPSVNTFITTYSTHLQEPDGPAHIYGHPHGEAEALAAKAKADEAAKAAADAEAAKANAAAAAAPTPVPTPAGEAAAPTPAAVHAGGAE